VPVLGRPHRVEPLLESLAAATSVPYVAVFVCSPGDDEELAAVRAAAAPAVSLLVADRPAGPGDFAFKTNLAYRWTEEPWLFTGADDLRFHPGWAEEALRVAAETGARVVGTNDLGNPTVMSGRHATHSLVARSYADGLGTLDGPGAVLCEQYDHQYVDTELVVTAQTRGEWAFADRSHVEHLHPFWGKGRMDATYERGLAGGRADRALFMSRSRRLRPARPVRLA
jgi:hypothetical protein